MTLLRRSLSAARPGLAVEFGVATGRTLRVIASARPGLTYGFDSFEGLPEDWREGFGQGRFAGPPPEVPGAELVKGLFADTLPGWLADHPSSELGFVHIDCDLYSSTSYVLGQLVVLQPGTVLLFDELIGYDGWEKHEHRALLEWVAEVGVRLEPLGSEGERAAFKVVG